MSFTETRGIQWRWPSACTITEIPSLKDPTLDLNFETPKNVNPLIYCPNITETVKKKARFLFNTIPFAVFFIFGYTGLASIGYVRTKWNLKVKQIHEIDQISSKNGVPFLGVLIFESRVRKHYN